MKNIFKKITLLFVFLVLATFIVFATDTQTVFNPFTQKPDMVRTGDFSDVNITIEQITVTEELNMSSKNITDVDCIHFISGGQICDSP